MKGNQNTGKFRILLVDDHASLRGALALALDREAGFSVVGEAGSLREAEALLDIECDIAIVDLGFPEGRATDFIRALKTRHRRSKVLVLTASLDPEDAALSVEAGASGVLSKNEGLDEIISSVERLAGGSELLSTSEVFEMLRIAAKIRQRNNEARAISESLTTREREVLQALSDGNSRDEICARLNISLSTEHTHITNILSKLGVHSRLEAVLFAARHDLTEIRTPTD